MTTIYESPDGGKTVYSREPGSLDKTLFKTSVKKANAAPLIPVSFGELVDKITILQIKLKEIRGEVALKNIYKELEALITTVAYTSIAEDVTAEYNDLFNINYKIWGLEEDVRKETNRDSFVSIGVTARQIYKANEERSRIKRKINEMCDSELIEEKSYKTIY